MKSKFDIAMDSEAILQEFEKVFAAHQGENGTFDPLYKAGAYWAWNYLHQVMEDNRQKAFIQSMATTLGAFQNKHHLLDNFTIFDYVQKLGWGNVAEIINNVSVEDKEYVPIFCAHCGWSGSSVNLVMSGIDSADAIPSCPKCKLKGNFCADERVITGFRDFLIAKKTIKDYVQVENILKNAPNGMDLYDPIERVYGDSSELADFWSVETINLDKLIQVKEAYERFARIRDGIGKFKVHFDKSSSNKKNYPIETVDWLKNISTLTSKVKTMDLVGAVFQDSYLLIHDGSYEIVEAVTLTNDELDSFEQLSTHQLRRTIILASEKLEAWGGKLLCTPEN